MELLFGIVYRWEWGGYNLIWQMWCVCGQGILRCKCGIVNWKYVILGVRRFNLIWQMWFGGQGILRCKCRMVNWKYVTVGVGRL